MSLGGENIMSFQRVSGIASVYLTISYPVTFLICLIIYLFFKKSIWTFIPLLHFALLTLSIVGMFL